MSRVLSVLFLVFCASAHAADVIPEVEAAAHVDAGSPLERSLRDERSRALDRLHDYAIAGRFPRNLDSEGYAHEFLDADGVPCAVANLIWQSGHEDLVRSTAASRNDVVLSDVTTGPLADWILTSGLTREEVAFIQAPAPPMPRSAPVDEQVAARSQLRARLLAVESVLRGDTDASIQLATERLGDR
jgi:hypothetical protein